MTTILAGDIGGTKTILRLVESEYLVTTPSATLVQRIESEYLVTPTPALPSQTLLAEQIFPSQEYADLVPIVRQFLNTATQTLGQPISIETACFGLAGPVVNNSSELTNLDWFLEANRLERDLGIPQVNLINDFAAIGYGVLGLSPQDVHTLQTGELNPQAPIAVIGAGTGLGEGFLIPQAGGRYQVFPTEGGHTDFAPQSAQACRLLDYLKEKNDLERVSVERVVSGMGIVSIYQFLRSQDVAEESPALAERYQIWQQEVGRPQKTVDLAAEISQAALAGTDLLCRKTMKIFIETYGAEAGNLALKLLPYGGLYIAGGIAAKNLPLLQQGNFMQSFQAKGRMRDLMLQIPVHVVLNPKVGLLGAGLYAAQTAFDRKS
jgi:glucokinase